jgi:hypothetical protein
MVKHQDCKDLVKTLSEDLRRMANTMRTQRKNLPVTPMQKIVSDARKNPMQQQQTRQTQQTQKPTNQTRQQTEKPTNQTRQQTEKPNNQTRQQTEKPNNQTRQQTDKPTNQTRQQTRTSPVDVKMNSGGDENPLLAHWKQIIHARSSQWGEDMEHWLACEPTRSALFRPSYAPTAATATSTQKMPAKEVVTATPAAAATASLATPAAADTLASETVSSATPLTTSSASPVPVIPAARAPTLQTFVTSQRPLMSSSLTTTFR